MNNKPNLMFRKAKMARKSVEKYMAKKITVPEIRGETLYGFHPVLESLRARKRDFYACYLKKTVISRAENDAKIAEILRNLDAFGIEKNVLNDDQLDRLTEYQLHNGICLDVSKLPFTNYASQRTSIFVDNVLDPGNVGAIARSAWYFGADGISYANRRGPTHITPSMSKSSCGAVEHLSIEKVATFDAFRDKIKSQGGEIVATCDPQASQKLGLRTKRLNDWRPSQNVAIVVGDEGQGIGGRILEMCDHVVAIDGCDATRVATNVTSLNVSVVTALLLHHISTHRN